MNQSFLIVYLFPIGLLFNCLVNCAPLYGEIESDIDTTKQSIVRANQILASINRDVDLCLSNSVACTLKSYDDLDYQTFEQQQQGSNSYNGNSDSLVPTTVTYSESTSEVNATLSPIADSTGSPSLSHYGRVPITKIVVPPSSDQKFTHVLDDIDSLEVHVQSAITNFTSTRRFTYTAMLKPMLKHIHQLRNNLSLLHNRLIGVAALTNIASQVNELSDHISDALVGGSDVPLDDTPSSPVSSSIAPSSSQPTSTTTTTTTSSPSITSSSQNPTTVNSQPNSSTIKVEPAVISSSTTQTPSSSSSSLPSNPTTINENDLIVETTTKTILGLVDDVDEASITSTIKPIY